MNNNQNMNSDKTSVKVHNPPGGQSSFSLGGGYGDDAPKKPVNKVNPNQSNNNIFGGPEEPKKQQPVQQPQQEQANQPAAGGAKTSVKVHNPPGGRSNFTLG